MPEAVQLSADGGDEELGVEPVAELPDGARINEKGQIVNAQGEVIGTAEELGFEGVGEPTEAVASTQSPNRASLDSGVNGPGVTDTTIKLGLMHQSDAEAFSDAVGAAGVGSFEFKRGWEALIKYQNAHGGIAGRRIVPVYWTMRVNSADSWPQQEQEECTEWTQDDHVIVGMTMVWSNNILQCMHDAGAGVIGLHGQQATTALHRNYPYYFEPSALALDRAAKATIDGLDRMGYFETDEKLGLVTIDHPNWRFAIRSGLIPDLRRRGIELADAAYLHYTGTTGDYAQLSNEAANAALRFKTQGIGHVIFLDQATNAAWMFMQAAEKQDYRPRYGLNGTTSNESLISLLGGDARPQLQDALSVGWMPRKDTPEDMDPDRKNPTRVLCHSIMQKAGVPQNSLAAKNNALAICDAMWSLASAVHGASVINQDTLLAGFNNLHADYSPGFVWSTFIDQTHHDGVSSVGNLRFVTDCVCFKYAGRPYSIL